MMPSGATAMTPPSYRETAQESIAGKKARKMPLANEANGT
jgi:hypothetical protein